MMSLDFTKDEIIALSSYINKNHIAINQMLVSDCESDIALLSDEVGKQAVALSYDKASVIENVNIIKLIYRLILKQFYKEKNKNQKLYRGTNLAEIERLKNDIYVDKPLITTLDKQRAESEYVEEWNRPVCINFFIDTNVPYINLREVLKEKYLDDTVLIAPFTKIRNVKLGEEKTNDNIGKDIKVYNVELEKQDLEPISINERNGLYDYILENSFSINRRLKECIDSEKENSKNFENIRKLEQLLSKYENSDDDEDEVDEDSLGKTDYDDIDRITLELEDLKKLSTKMFEERKKNIDFVNNWKRNIAVYLMAECRNIEEEFELELEYNREQLASQNVPKLEFEEIEKSDIDELILKKANEDTDSDEETYVEDDEDLYVDEEAEDVSALEITGLNPEPIIVNNDDTIENDSEEVIKEADDELQEEVPQDTIVVKEETQEIEETEKIETFVEHGDVFKRAVAESKENIAVAKNMLEQIKQLISKQQNHAKIAGNMGATYSALNNAFDMKKSAETLIELLQNLDLKIKVVSEGDRETNLDEMNRISKVNLEISTLMNYLNNPKIAIRNTKLTRFDEMAIIEENELKRNIAEAIRDIMGEAELKKLKDDMEIIEEKGAFKRIIGMITGQNRLDEFMIEQIEIRKDAIKRTLSKKMSLSYNYSIHELMAYITMFVDENENDDLVSDDVTDLKAMAEELRRNYIILESKVQNIVEEKEGKNLPLDEKRISKMETVEIETYRFLKKYGYDNASFIQEDPEYQDTTANEIERINEYIKSSEMI